MALGEIANAPGQFETSSKGKGKRWWVSYCTKHTNCIINVNYQLFSIRMLLERVECRTCNIKYVSHHIPSVLAKLSTSWLGSHPRNKYTFIVASQVFHYTSAKGSNYPWCCVKSRTISTSKEILQAKKHSKHSIRHHLEIITIAANTQHRLRNPEPHLLEKISWDLLRPFLRIQSGFTSCDIGVSRMNQSGPLWNLPDCIQSKEDCYANIGS
jgi:hypothetical protein